jgi:hypothetical protein
MRACGAERRTRWAGKGQVNCEAASGRDAGAVVERGEA